MTTTTLDFETAFAALDKIVSEVPEGYTYSPVPRGGDDAYANERICKYAGPDNKPSCIIGQLVNELDPSQFEKLRVAESSKRGSFGVSTALTMAAEYDLSPALVDALQAVQNAQDLYKPWKRAVEEGRSEYQRALARL